MSNQSTTKKRYKNEQSGNKTKAVKSEYGVDYRAVASVPSTSREGDGFKYYLESSTLDSKSASNNGNQDKIPDLIWAPDPAPSNPSDPSSEAGPSRPSEMKTIHLFFRNGFIQFLRNPTIRSPEVQLPKNTHSDLNSLFKNMHFASIHSNHPNFNNEKYDKVVSRVMIEMMAPGRFSNWAREQVDHYLEPPPLLEMFVGMEIPRDLQEPDPIMERVKQIAVEEGLKPLAERLESNLGQGQSITDSKRTVEVDYERVKYREIIIKQIERKASMISSLEFVKEYFNTPNRQEWYIITDVGTEKCALCSDTRIQNVKHFYNVLQVDFPIIPPGNTFMKVSRTTS